MCDKTCIFFFFPVVNKYFLMAKRSLLSRCPSYNGNIVEVRDSTDIPIIYVKVIVSTVPIALPKFDVILTVHRP